MAARIIFVLLVLSALAIAQPRVASNRQVQTVEVCELIHHPKTYDGKIVRVRARVVLVFENFSLYSDCGAAASRDEHGVWVTFGGDEPEIATFCCGSFRRKKGTDFEVAGHKVGLVRDTAFYKFFHELRAQRLRRPDGKQCGDECRLYSATATITGLFAMATAEGGYGHLGMFHLLVIRQVSEVSAERSAVPFGGTFACSTETWEPREEAPLLAASLRCTGSDENSCMPNVRFSRAAAHWNDDVSHGSTTEGYSDTHGNVTADWASSDLLTSYFTKTDSAGHVSITREHCVASPDRAPKPSSTMVACAEYQRSLPESISRTIDRLLAKDEFPAAWAKMVQGARQLFSSGDQSWRLSEAKTAAWHVLQEQVQLWHLTPDRDLQFDKCQDSSSDETPILLGCNWYSPDGAQKFQVSLLKERQPTEALAGGPWLVTAVDAQICRQVGE